MSLIIELINALVKLPTLVFIGFFFSNYIESDVDLVSECLLNMEKKKIMSTLKRIGIVPSK